MWPWPAPTGAVVLLTWSVHRLEGVHTHWETLHLFVISVMAGASGAFLSVLSRMASPMKKFTTNFELGRKNVRWMGIYRSFVGAIFGGATFLMLASGILQTQDAGDKDYAYYGILAFFSGFFERFTKLTPTGGLCLLRRRPNLPPVRQETRCDNECHLWSGHSRSEDPLSVGMTS